jgi:hypothetical protein
MSTTLSTFNRTAKPYTVIGGESAARSDKSPGLSIILLNRGGKFHRDELLRELCAPQSVQVVYIEGPEHSYDIEPLSKKNPSVKFLLLQDAISTGEKITLGFEESDAPLCLVMWSDMRIMQNQVTEKTLHRIDSSGVFCTVPVLKNTKLELIPSILVPAIFRKHLQILPFNPVRDGSASIYPFDYAGLYRKEKYFSIGGFDPRIGNPYWQKMDLGFRAFMWGERIQLSTSLTLQYTSSLATEDATPDSSYKFFFLKNMFVSAASGEGRINPLRVIQYIAKADTGPVKSWKEFQDASKWIKQNSKSFRKDAKSLIKAWEAPE